MATTIKTHVSELAAVAATLIGLVIYLVNSTTGYMAGQGLNALVIGLSVVAMVALAVRVFAGDRLPEVLNDVLLVGSEVLLLVSFAQFVLERVRLAADIYFIPVNYPASEQTSLNVALIGVACYLVAIVLLVAKAFTAKDVRRAAIMLEPAVE
jgi:hypothetical protein